MSGTDSINEVIGIEDNISRRDFGRERGVLYFWCNDSTFALIKTYIFHGGHNPIPTEAQNKAIDKLAAKLSTARSFIRASVDEEESVNFDIKSKKRVILFEAKVIKKSKLNWLIFNITIALIWLCS